MKLYYYRNKHGIKNFGDDLNSWIWPQLLPGVFDERADSLFVGIGTLINRYLPKEPLKVIFGSGAGYADGGLPTIDESYRFYCVRGPHTAKALGLSQDLAITDAAILLRKLHLRQEKKTYQASFIPHWQSAECYDWKIICEDIGLHYIDPRADVETVLYEILRSKLIITEAMHGAIVADAFRVPWVSVRAYKHILEFKWHDWCQSLNLSYKPISLPALYKEEKVINKLRQSLESNKLLTARPISAMIETGTKQLSRGLNQVLANQASQILVNILKDPKPELSSEAVIELATSRLEEQLDCFKNDHALGRLEGV